MNEQRMNGQLNQIARLHTALRHAREALVAADALADALAQEIDAALNFGEGEATENLERHIAAEVERRRGRRSE
jgi:hypothetical protein